MDYLMNIKTFNCNICRATTVELNPIGNGVVNTAVGRGEVVPMVTFLKRGILPDAANFESKTSFSIVLTKQPF